MKPLIRNLLLLIAVLLPAGGAAQIVTTRGIINSDSIQRAFADTHYYFGAYKDNYFIFGCPIGQKITRETANAKFQISVAQKLTKSTLPWGTYLYLFYTQKVFWNVLQKSLPMTDLNFNPGVGLIKPLFIKDDYIGKLGLIIEHESNGRDSIFSRSWNKITFAGSFELTAQLGVSGKIWIPIIDGGENKDVLCYKGMWETGVHFHTLTNRFAASAIFTRRAGKFFNYNTCVELTWSPWNNTSQGFFLQYYNGYGEDFMNMRDFKSQLRIGFVIRPTLFADF